MVSSSGEGHKGQLLVYDWRWVCQGVLCRFWSSVVVRHWTERAVIIIFQQDPIFGAWSAFGGNLQSSSCNWTKLREIGDVLSSYPSQPEPLGAAFLVNPFYGHNIHH